MCGIAGCFSPAPLPEDVQSRLDRASAAIAHRGPDGQGRQLFPHAALIHTRLAIIDLDQGAQPMSHDQGRYWISFNGEIYNYQSLRKALIKNGVSFQTHSDTEVILALWKQQGAKGLSRLRGMYAIALWDRKLNQGLLLRDPCGIKPLFIQHRSSGALVFGSEAKAILAYNNEKATLNESSLHLLMNFRYLPGNHSLIRHIEQLPPGQLLHWQLDQQGHAITHTEALKPAAITSTDTMAALEESIQLHTVADVQVGAYLSGGMDSAAIVALSKQPLPTFTLAIGDDPNEAQYAQRSAQIFQVSNHLGRVDEQHTPDLHHLVSHLEVPKINALQVGLLAQNARQEVKVTLSGIGGDELFLGYNAHRFMHLADRTEHYTPHFLSKLTGNTLSAILSTVSPIPWSEPERAFQMLARLGNWSEVYGLMRNVWDQPKLRSALYGPRMLDHTLPDVWDELNHHWSHSTQETDPVFAMRNFENQHKLVNDLLWQEDRLSMAHGLEVRTPFVDQTLRTHLNRWSRQQLMPGGHAKGGMRDLLSRTLPKEILQRPKSGFQVASGAFFHRYLMPLAQHYLSPENVRRHGLFNPQWVARSLKFPTSKAYRWHYFILYLMLLTHIWVELFEQDTWNQHL